MCALIVGAFDKTSHKFGSEFVGTMRIPRRLAMHPRSPLSLRQRSISRIQVFLTAVIYLIGLQIPSARASWVDPDTPTAGRTTKALSHGDHREYELVSARIMLGSVRGKIPVCCFLVVAGSICKSIPLSSSGFLRRV
jgi:hypothetical protein